MGKLTPRACCLRAAALRSLSHAGANHLEMWAVAHTVFMMSLKAKERKEWCLTKWGRQIKERGVYVYPGLCFFPIVEGNSDEMDGIDVGKNTRKRDRLKKGYRTGLAMFLHAERGQTILPIDISHQRPHMEQISRFTGTTTCLLAFFFF